MSGSDPILISGPDHLVLTVRDIAATLTWHRDVLGRQERRFDRTPGSIDLCLVSAASMPDVVAHLERVGVPVEHRPVARTRATGPIDSVYVRDPDGNLIEISSYRRGRPAPPNPYHLLPPATQFAVASLDIYEDRTMGQVHAHPLAGGANHSPALAWRAGPPGTRRYFGAAGYIGPRPPVGDGCHRYVFAVHALSTERLDESVDASAAVAGLKITGHTLARGLICATYQRNRR